MLEDTIVAVSTPPGYGGLGIVRLSGTKAHSIAKAIFQPQKSINTFPARKALFGLLHNPVTQEAFDEAYLVFFPAPHSYTREDVVEITCHGSPVILEEAVRLSMRAGAKHAGPGEFTLRAYINGRIDIIQAEAVRDLIEASSLTQARISFHQSKGRLSHKIQALRALIIKLLSQIEAAIEFPDESLRVTPKQILNTLKKTAFQLEQLIKSYPLGKMISEGLNIAITGRPNVGKSTLFNVLLESDRAIVTPYAGTTRDILREKIHIDDAIFTLIDMAGIANPRQPVEKEGIKRGRKSISEADGILLLVDASKKEEREDEKLIAQLKNKKTLLLFNKCDLPVKANIQKLKTIASEIKTLEISALKKQNIQHLKQEIRKTFIPQKKTGEETVLHLRQKLLLEKILEKVLLAKSLLEEGYPEDYYVEELRTVLPVFGELSGEIRSEDIIQNIFSRFCVGK